MPSLPSFVTGYNPAYGGIPNVPSPGASAGSAVGANLGNLAAIYNLTGSVNTQMAGQAADQLRLNLPKYSSLITQRSQNIGSKLRGEVPRDVIDLLLTNAAERGITTGSPGGPNANASYLRALGLTSLGLMSQGDQELNQAMAATPRADLMYPQTMFVTPEQWQQAQMASNLYGSAPNPAAAAQEAYRRAVVGSGGKAPGGRMFIPNFSPGSYTPMPSTYSAPDRVYPSLSDTMTYSSPSRAAYDWWGSNYGPSNYSSPPLHPSFDEWPGSGADNSPLFQSPNFQPSDYGWPFSVNPGGNDLYGDYPGDGLHPAFNDWPGAGTNYGPRFDGGFDDFMSDYSDYSDPYMDYWDTIG